MHKAPALWFVGITAGVVGAGLMWLFTRGPAEIRNAGAPRPAQEPAARRIGVPESYESHPEIEAMTTGARRVQPSILSAVASQTGQPSEAVAPKSAEGESSAAHSGVSLSFPAASSAAGSAPRSGGVWRVTTTSKHGTGADVDDALSVALEAAVPYVKAGFHVREDYWGGTLDRSPKAITHQLFRGNEYWFWMGTLRPNAGIAVHVFDSDGNLAEAEYWRRKNVAAARVVPERTGTYYLIISADVVEGGSASRIPWGLAYGFR